MPEDKTQSTVDLLKQVCDIMEARELAEVYLKEGTLTLRVKRAGAALPAPLVAPPASHAGSQTTSTEALPPPSPEEGEVIKPPMPGRFYRAPEPDKPPYVEVGDVVAESDTLCQIEAMKIFNDVTAPFPCEIREILVENDTVVEYDQPLFRILRS